LEFNRDKFFDFYRQHFGSLQQNQVDGLNILLAGFEQIPEWKDLRHCAYALATAKHETAHTFLPITEYGSNAYFQRYEGRQDLGNTVSGDGLKFKGRGFVQITGRKNYSRFANLLKVDLLNNPKLALDPVTAFKIMTIGMHKGYFTGKKLTDYINDEICDYVNARKIINGLDKAATIANYAKRFYQILRQSKISNESPIDNPKPTSTLQSESSPNNEAGAPIGADVPTSPSNPTESAGTANTNAAGQSQAVESSSTKTVEQAGTTVEQKVEVKNEQDVNQTEVVSAPEPYNQVGFWATIKRDLAWVFGGNASIQTASEYAHQAQATVPASLLTKLAYVIAAASVCYLLFRLVHFAIDSWKKNQKVKLLAEINTDVSRKNIELKD
jgi:putative chitinase